MESGSAKKANANEQNATVRPKRELLEHVAKDQIVQRVHEKFGATIREIVDLGAGEKPKDQGMAPADYWQTKIFGKPAKAAPIAHAKFSQAELMCAHGTVHAIGS